MSQALGTPYNATQRTHCAPVSRRTTRQELSIGMLVSQACSDHGFQECVRACVRASISWPVCACEHEGCACACVCAWGGSGVTSSPMHTWDANGESERTFAMKAQVRPPIFGRNVPNSTKSGPSGKKTCLTSEKGRHRWPVAEAERGPATEGRHGQKASMHAHRRSAWFRADSRGSPGQPQTSVHSSDCTSEY